METLWLSRPCADVPWGFRLQGGADFTTPLSIQRVTVGSVAASRLNAGDIILKIGNVNAAELSHVDGQDLIRHSGNNLQLTIKKGGGVVVNEMFSPEISGHPVYDSNADYVYKNPPSRGYDAPSQPNQQVYGGDPLFVQQMPADSSDGFRSLSDPYSQPNSYGYVSPVTPTPRHQYYTEPYSPQTYHQSPEIYNDNNSYYNNAHTVNNMTPTYSNAYQPSPRSAAHNENYIVSQTYTPSPAASAPQHHGQDDYSTYQNNRVAEVKPNFGQDSSAFSPTQAAQQASYFSGHQQAEPQQKDVTPLTSPSTYNARGNERSSPSYYYSSGYDGGLSPVTQAAVVSAGVKERPEENLYWAKPINISNAPDYRSNSYDDQPHSLNTSGVMNVGDDSVIGEGHSSPYSAVSHQGNPPLRMTSYQEILEPSYIAEATDEPAPVAPAPPALQALPPPPPPPPPPPMMPDDWKPTKKMTHKVPEHETETMNPYCNSGGTGGPHGIGNKVPDALLNTMLKNKDQKPFAYITSGIDLKEIAEKRKQTYNQNAQRKGPKVNMQAAKKDQNQAMNVNPQQYHSSPRMEPATPATPVTQGAGSGLFIHGQYNSPLGLYSSDIATEELSQQSGGVITNVGGSDSLKISGGPTNDPCRLPEKPKKDYRDSEVYKLINENESSKRAEDARRAEEAAEMKLSGSNPSKQSLSFKVLQWMTDTEKPAEAQQDTPTDVLPMEAERRSAPEPPPKPAPSADKAMSPTVPSSPGYISPTASRKKQRNPLLRHNSEDDEMRFSGLHGKHDIPSKSFKMLQNLTVNDSQDDNSSQGTQDDDSGQVGNYCEASIRYKGKHIPSPSFRVLQNWADHDPEPIPDEMKDEIEDFKFKEEEEEEKGEEKKAEEQKKEEEKVEEEVEEEEEEEGVGNYIETSIRYRGKNNPSPSFNLLKAWTDGDLLGVGYHMRRSRPKPRPSTVDEEDKNDGPSEVRYSGGHIPSRVFKVLQMSVGGSEPIEPTSSANQSADEDKHVRTQPRQSRSMRIIQRAKAPQQESGCTDF